MNRRRQDRFAKLVILDQLLLTDRQVERLEACADEVAWYSRIDPVALLREVHREMEQNPAPMCWTQLAQEEVTREELTRRLEGADAVVTCWTGLPDEILAANPQLRYIGFWTNLAAHRINLDVARDLGIHVTYLPDYGTEAVAEMTLAGILSVSRRLGQAARDTERGKWPYELLKTGVAAPVVEDLPQRTLAGQTLGIVGFGRIGQRVAELAQAFHMKVHYHSRNRYVEWEERGALYMGLEELFDTSDIVTVHLAPYAPAGIINAQLLGRLRDGALFVNTSAGRLVDQAALFDELRSGRISAYLDVYESLPPRSEIKALGGRRNLFTYRSGWFTREALIKKGDSLVERIQAYLRGEPGPAAWESQSVPEEFSEKPCGPVLD